MVAQPGTVRPRRAGYLKLRDQSRRGCRRWSGRGGLVLRPTEQPRGKIPSIGAEPTRIGPRAPASPNRERRVPSPLLGWSRRSGRRRARWIRNPYPLVGGCDAVAPEHVAAVRILNNPRLHRCRRNIGRVRVSGRGSVSRRRSIRGRRRVVGRRGRVGEGWRTSAAFQNCPTPMPMPMGDATPKPVTTPRGVTVDLS